MNAIDKIFLERTKVVVLQHIADAEFTAECFAQQMLISRSQLHRKLKALTGRSATDYIRCLRLLKASKLLEETSISVADIARQVGFNNLSYFARCFREVYHCAPSEFRKRKRYDSNL